MQFPSWPFPTFSGVSPLYRQSSFGVWRIYNVGLCHLGPFHRRRAPGQGFGGGLRQPLDSEGPRHSRGPQETPNQISKGFRTPNNPL